MTEGPRMADPLVTRRTALGTGVGALASLYLAACGGSSGGGEASKEVAKDLSKAKLEDSVLLYNYAEYDDPSIFDRFTTAVGPKTRMEFYGSSDEATTKLRAGGTSYDAVVLSSYDIPDLGKRGALLPLDHELLPNLANLQDSFKDSEHDPGSKYSIVNDFGLTSFYYRTDVVTEPPATLREWFDELPRYKGKNVNFLAGASEVIPLAMAALGHDVNSVDEAHYEEALKMLVAVKPVITTVNSSYVERLTQGEIDLGIGWNGGVARAARTAAKKDIEIKYFVPPEKGLYWITTWGIPASAPHPVAAHAWLNFLLDPENAAIQWNFTGYPRPVEGATDFVDKEISSDPALNIPEATLSSYQAALSNQAVNKLRAKYYTRFQSA